MKLKVIDWFFPNDLDGEADRNRINVVLDLDGIKFKGVIKKEQIGLLLE